MNVHIEKIVPLDICGPSGECLVDVFLEKHIGLKNFIMKLKGLETAARVTNEMNVLDGEIFLYLFC